MPDATTAEIAAAVTEELTGVVDEKVAASMAALREEITGEATEAVQAAAQESILEQVTATLTDPEHGEALSEALAPLVEKLAPNKSEANRPPFPKAGTLAELASINTAAYNPDASGAVLDGKWANFRDFLASVNGVRHGRTDERLMAIGGDGEPKALGEADFETGGALVPEEFRAQMMAVMLQNASIRQRCFQIPMGTLSISIPAIRDTTHASNVFGGVSAQWEDEGDEITASEPEFTQIRLTAKKLAFLTSVKNELLADSPISVEALLMQLYGAAIPWFEEKAFIRGTGVGQPAGVLNADALVSIAKETNQPDTTIVVENINKMYARMIPSSLGRAVWMYNPDTFPELASMALSVGTGGGPVWVGNIAGGPPATIYGRPLIPNEHMGTLGTVGDLVFVDWFYYLLGDRQALSMASSAHAKFTSDQTVFRGIERLDGRPWIESAITPAQGSDDLSPFVAIAARP